MSTVQVDLAPERQAGESFKGYRKRRRIGNLTVKQYLRGRMFHISTLPVRLPALGVDARIDEAVLRGDYRDLRQITLSNGEIVHIGRTKGVTYRRPREL